MLETNNGQEPRRRRTPLSPAAADATREHDPAYLAQIRARKVMLQAQAVLLRAQESCLEAAGAAD